MRSLRSRHMPLTSNDFKRVDEASGGGREGFDQNFPIVFNFFGFPPNAFVDSRRSAKQAWRRNILAFHRLPKLIEFKVTGDNSLTGLASQLRRTIKITTDLLTCPQVCVISESLTPWNEGLKGWFEQLSQSPTASHTITAWQLTGDSLPGSEMVAEKMRLGIYHLVGFTVPCAFVILLMLVTLPVV